jgi:hypothetical protein
MSEYNVGNKLQNITLNRGLEVYSNETVLEPENRNLSEDLEQILDEDLDDDKVLDKVLDKVSDDDKNTDIQIQILEPESNNDIFKYLFIFSLVVIGILIYNRNVK